MRLILLCLLFYLPLTLPGDLNTAVALLALLKPKDPWSDLESMATTEVAPHVRDSKRYDALFRYNGVPFHCKVGGTSLGQQCFFRNREGETEFVLSIESPTEANPTTHALTLFAYISPERDAASDLDGAWKKLMKGDVVDSPSLKHALDAALNPMRMLHEKRTEVGKELYVPESVTDREWSHIRVLKNPRKGTVRFVCGVDNREAHRTPERENMEGLFNYVLQGRRKMGDSDFEETRQFTQLRVYPNKGLNVFDVEKEITDSLNYRFRIKRAPESLAELEKITQAAKKRKAGDKK